ncbi:GNAT family N-acetyltransferase [Pantanalinema sp. GBBB05]|uniref:GNAT family N-acetyltransferase n=1 Tax=Pantanalinema sp. GBBB05 TaxID=2604139 RepID=UPI001E130CFE|nr:GNAT family N-acetyltransferase [Pantanalinema sp. GBBB05]
MDATPYRVELFDTPPPSLRDALANWQSPNGFESLMIPWSELACAVNPGKVELRWLVVQRESVLCAVGVVYIVRGLAIGDYVGGALERLTQVGRRIGYVPLTVDVAFFEIPLANREGIFFSKEVDIDEQAAILKTVVETLNQQLPVDAICVKAIAKSPILSCLNSDMLELPFIELNVLELPGNPLSFETWLAERSHKLRSNVRRNRRIFAKSGAVFEAVNNPAPYAEKLAELTVRTAARGKSRGEIPIPMSIGVPFFEHFYTHLEDRGSIHLARVDEAIVGFSVLLFGHDTVFGQFLGLDYEISRQNMTYFEIYYDTIDSAVERGLRYVDMGSGTSHVKIPLGCRQIPKVYHIQFRRFLRPFSGIMSTLLGSRFGKLFH